MSAKDGLTPALKQYLEIKSKYPDALLFFRMGDFYELFFEDAQIASRELQIALTSRNPNSENPVPMCGVPYHAVSEYLKILLEKRYKVAICEQIEDPKKAKGIVKRAVTKVLTPGTVVEEIGIFDKKNNFLAAACFDKNNEKAALCWIDFSTGDWMGFETKDTQKVWEWLVKIDPSEVILPEGERELSKNFVYLKDKTTWVNFDLYFNYLRAKEEICHIYNVPNLDPLDLKGKKLLVQCCGALIAYLKKNHNTEFSHLKNFKILNLSKYLLIDEITERNLEIFKRLDGSKGKGTLYHTLDYTMTPMGGRLLEKRLKHPFKEIKPILQNQEVVSFLFKNEQIRHSLRSLLNKIFDLERIINRIFLGRATPKDFISLKQSIFFLPKIKIAIQKEEQQPEALRELLKDWDDLEEVYNLIEQSLVDNPPQVITEGGLFKKGYNQKLDELIELAEHGERKIKDLLEKEQKKNNMPKLKMGYNKVFGYYFELPKSYKGKVPPYFHRKQTLVNAERYITEELKTIEEKIFTASEKRKELEYQLFLELREEISKKRERIIKMAEKIANLDLWQSFAEAAIRWDWTKPEVHLGQEIIIKGGRHPVIEAHIGKQNYIPNDVRIDDTSKILIITGPNMAGKSTVLRQTAIICILAQMGSFIPAEYGKIGICDKIFTRVGASDNLIEGQSTFMQEMVETARILRQATKKSLVILDEIGRGTSTYDGMAIAWAVVETLSKKEGGVRTLFATHYHELTVLEKELSNVRNYNIAVKEWKGEMIFLRKMLPGPSDKSYGIEVAKLAGIPINVIRRAKEILQNLEEKGKFLKVDRKKEHFFTLFPKEFLKDKNNKKEEKNKEHPILNEIKNLDVNNLTPLEALQLIAEWKKRV